MMKFVLLSCIAMFVTGQDVTFEANDITASFMGASGGMKLMNSAEDKFVMLQQSKLEEVDEAGKKVVQGVSINVAGQNQWEELDATEGYSAKFTVEEGGVSFMLLVHFSSTTITTTDVVPCSGCADQTGSCSDSANSTMCMAAFENMTCPEGYTACTESVSVVANEIKYSMMIEGLTFKNTENKLSYAITLKSKGKGGDDQAPEEEDMGKGKKASIAGVGYVEMPGEAIIKGGDADETVPVTVTIETGASGSMTTVNFLFDSWEPGKALYYDPSVGLEETAGSAAVKGSLFVSAACVIFALVFSI